MRRDRRRRARRLAHVPGSVPLEPGDGARGGARGAIAGDRGLEPPALDEPAIAQLPGPRRIELGQRLHDGVGRPVVELGAQRPGRLVVEPGQAGGDLGRRGGGGQLAQRPGLRGRGGLLDERERDLGRGDLDQRLAQPPGHPVAEPAQPAGDDPGRRRRRARAGARRRRCPPGRPARRRRAAARGRCAGRPNPGTCRGRQRPPPARPRRSAPRPRERRPARRPLRRARRAGRPAPRGPARPARGPPGGRARCCRARTPITSSRSASLLSITTQRAGSRAATAR